MYNIVIAIMMKHKHGLYAKWVALSLTLYAPVVWLLYAHEKNINNQYEYLSKKLIECEVDVSQLQQSTDRYISIATCKQTKGCMCENESV
jgi:hypothetical protein